MVAAFAVLAAVAFSVSVESRSSGWLRSAAPQSARQSSPPAVEHNADATKNSAAGSSYFNSNHPLSANSLPNPLAPIVTASKTDSLFTDVDGDTKADPGDTLKYTVVIGASGMDATGVMFTDTIDPNTSFVAGTLMTTPLARDDSYSASGNIRITVAAPGVLANDSDPDGVGPALNVTAGAFLSTQGGNVNLSADGSFTYNPPAGFEGADTFSYTLNDGEGPSDTGTVTITVSGMIWFIDNHAGVGDGRLTNPFNTLAAFHALNDGIGNHPAANDNIFVYESGIDYVGPVTLLSGQKFIGQDATATLSSISGVTPAPGSDPLPATNSGNATIVNITGNGITVGMNNTLRGFTGGNSTSDIDGSGFGTLNISDVILSGTGRALSLTNGTLAATFGSIASTSSATTGITLSSVSGNLTSGSTTISSPTGIGISVGSSGATLNFGNTTVAGSGNTGVSLTANTGTISFGALNISPNANQRGLLATDNTNTITTTSGAINTSGSGAINAAGVEITRASSTTPLAIALSSVSTTDGTNGIFLRNTSGSFTVNGDGANTSVGGNSTGGTISGMSGADGATTGNAVYMDNAGNVTLRRMTITGTNQNHGIRGINFSNFALEFSTVTGSNGTSTALDEGSLNFNNLTGTAAITSCVIDGGLEDNLNLVNTSGTLNRLTISGSVFGFNSTANGNNNILIESQNAGTTLNFTLKSSTIKGARADWINASNNSSSTMDAVIGGPLVADGNMFDNLGVNAHPNPAAGGNRVVMGAVGNQTVDIRNNILKGSKGEAIRVRSTATGAVTGTVNARVRNNTIGLAGTANSGSSESFGIFAFGDGGSSMNIAITNNSVFQYNNTGINLQFGDEINDGSVFNATVTGNTLSNPGNLNTDFNGIQLNNGTVGATDNFTTCADIGGAGGLSNSVSNTGSGGTPPNNVDIRLRQRQATTVRLPGYGGANNNNAAVVTYLSGRNTLVTADASNTVPTGGGFIGGAACTAPSFAALSESSSVSSTSDNLTIAAPASDDLTENILWAAKGENSDPRHVLKLTQSEVTAMVQAAIARWAEAGVSAKNMARLQALSFEIADLPAGQLATATSSKITLDETAAGYGWFFDATPSDDNEFDVPVENQERQATELSPAGGRVDLLTVLMRQLGSGLSQGKSALKGPAGWLMEGTLEPGTRRAPSFKASSIGKGKSAPTTTAKQVRTGSEKSEKSGVSYQSVASVNGPRNSRVLKHHATRTAATPSLADVMLNIGVLPAGKSITITFNATVNDPFLGAGATVCNQGTVSGINFADVLTDDPDVVGTADATCTPIDLQADLEVTKTDSPDPVIAGNNITYTINFTNNGPNASGATVTDATPAGTTFVSASVTTGSGWGTTNPSVGGTGNVVFSKASVASGESAVFQVVVKVGSGVAGGTIITNNATAATTGASDPVPGNNTGTATTTVIAQADLSITKTDGATTEIPGTPVTYTIVVTNSGPSDANGAMVSDTFPGILSGVTYTSIAAGGATGNTAAGAGNISDSLNMPAGSSVTYTATGNIASSATGDLTNTATVTEPAGVTDPNAANNSATDTDTLTPQADLSITKTDGATTEVPGTPVTYTIVVSNSGPSDANGVTVSDNFPGILSGVTYTSIAAGGASGNTAAGAGNISDSVNMPTGSSITYTATGNISSSATGSLSNTATVTEPAGVTDPNGANNSATDTDALAPEADLSITKTDGATTEVPGTPVTYTIVVSNSGPSDANGVIVSDTFPGIISGVSYTSIASGGATGNTAAGAGNISDTVNMPSGSSITYTATGNIASSATGTLSNTATVTAPGGVTDPNGANNSATDIDTLSPEADVSVTKSDSPDPVIAGNNITYSITVTNNGPSDAVSLSLSDNVPANTTLVSVTTPAGWSRTDAVPAGGTGAITFTKASLAASAFSNFTIVVNVNAGTANGTTISNTASVSSATTDPTPGNNSATATTLVQNQADLAVTKTRSPLGTIEVGSNVTYTVKATNNGPTPASSVTLTDVVPSGTSLVSQTSPAGWTCNTIPVGGTGTITCTKSSMANGEMATLTVVVSVNCNVANGATISNTASIGAVSPSDNDLTNNSATASFVVSNPAPVVTATVQLSELPQNNHELIDVGLAALASDGNCPTPTSFMVQVFGNEDDETQTAKKEVFSPDAKDIGIGTLRLRAERINEGDGRVYLIVVKTTDGAGGTGFATVTVVISKSNSPQSSITVNALAAAAKAYADSHNGAPPPGYFVIGDGPIIGPKQ